MTRFGLGVLGILLGALACAPTFKTVHGRSVNFDAGGDVKEVSPGHWAGNWQSVGVNLEPGEKGEEEAMPCSETGYIDMVWVSPTELKSCTNKSTRTCSASDGSTNVGENTMTCKPGLKPGLLMFEGGGRQVSATGRFAGNEAEWTFTAWQLVQPPGQSYSVYTAKVTPKK